MQKPMRHLSEIKKRKTQELLNLFNRHPPLEQRRCHGVPEEMRIHALGDLRLRGRFFHR